MRILLIRHAEPDYENDTLTDHGFIEAKALASYYKDLKIDEIYTSPLPRAKLTCEEFSNFHRNIKVNVINEFIEFDKYRCLPPYEASEVITWDFLPKYFEPNKELEAVSTYLDSELLRDTSVKNNYKNVIAKLDNILESHGYKRNELGYYDVIDSNTKTIVVFAHHGLNSVLLSHLLKIPHVIIAQHFCALPSSVTLLVTEEREKGIAQFRCLKFGDTNHLKVANVEESFHARFAEIFDSPDRH